MYTTVLLWWRIRTSMPQTFVNKVIDDGLNKGWQRREGKFIMPGFYWANRTRKVWLCVKLKLHRRLMVPAKILKTDRRWEARRVTMRMTVRLTFSMVALIKAEYFWLTVFLVLIKIVWEYCCNWLNPVSTMLSLQLWLVEYRVGCFLAWDALVKGVQLPVERSSSYSFTSGQNVCRWLRFIWHPIVSEYGTRAFCDWDCAQIETHA